MSADQPSAEVVDRVADLLKSRIGLRPDLFARGQLGRSIRDEAALYGQDGDDYLQMLSVTGSALQSLLNRVTVQESGFFRHPEQFELLAREILPAIPQPVTIWSAGCANGQEPFSLAMLLDELGVSGSVIATDLSTQALERTTKARYQSRELDGLSPDRIARHLRQSGGVWEINQALRERVVTLRHNLMSPLPDEVRSSQVVFCRNVLIYFSPDHTKDILDRVAETMPTAWLFLGAAETIWTDSDKYETVRFGEAYVYRPRLASTLALRRRTAPRRGGVTAASRPIPAEPQVRPSCADADAADDDLAVLTLARAGQQAAAEGDHLAAVVHFRKWVYLAHDDALAHLHLGLALEAAGDQPSAQRAFGAARRVLQEVDAAQVERALGGYAPAELRKLLDAKHREQTP